MNSVILIAISAGFILSIAIGANDAANSLGMIISSKSIGMQKALFMASIFEFIGLLLGFNSKDDLTKNMV